MGIEMNVNQELDLRGEVCPYTFVKSKLALEDLEIGQVLRVLVDNDESGENVPKSLANEGQAVLGCRRRNDTDWEIVVRKERE